jgi:hypothetical protein
MFADELSPAEREALDEIEEAERALELARLRFVAVASQNRGRSRRRGRLRIVGEPVDGEPCDARR